MHSDVSYLEFRVNLVKGVHELLCFCRIGELAQICSHLFNIGLIVSKPYSNVFDGVHGKVLP